MKKLVTLFTLAIAMVASADVASQNIVGYTTKSLAAGFNHICPSFVQVGGATKQMLLNDFVGAEEMDSVQFLDTETATAAEYFWLVEGSASPDVTGWYADDFTTPAGDTPIAAGTSVLFSSLAGGALTTSGEVNADSVTLQTVAGFNIVGNPFPVATTLSQINFANIQEMDSVQFMSEEAATASEYFWLVEGSASPDVTGWYADDFTTPAGDTVVGSGAGFLFSNNMGENVAITISSPLAVN